MRISRRSPAARIRSNSWFSPPDWLNHASTTCSPSMKTRTPSSLFSLNRWTPLSWATNVPTQRAANRSSGIAGSGEPPPQSKNTWASIRATSSSPKTPGVGLEKYVPTSPSAPETQASGTRSPSQSSSGWQRSGIPSMLQSLAPVEMSTSSETPFSLQSPSEQTSTDPSPSRSTAGVNALTGMISSTPPGGVHQRRHRSPPWSS